MPATRIPYWLSQPDRVALAESIIALMDTATVLPRIRDRLDAVLTELGVVEARDKVWPTQSELVRRATGYAPDVLPIQMSREERDAVLALTGLPDTVRARLTDPDRAAR